MLVTIIWQDKTFKVVFRPEYSNLAGLISLVSRRTELPINDIDASFKNKDGQLISIDVDDDISELMAQSKNDSVEIYVQDKTTMSNKELSKASPFPGFSSVGISEIKGTTKQSDIGFSDINIGIFNKPIEKRDKSPDFDKFKVTTNNTKEPVPSNNDKHSIVINKQPILNNAINTENGKVNRRISLTKSNVHQIVQCDTCAIYPVVGVRYKCLVCLDYDRCEECENLNAHEHEMIKITKPLSNVDLSILVTNFLNVHNKQIENEKNKINAQKERSEVKTAVNIISKAINDDRNGSAKDFIGNHMQNNSKDDKNSTMDSVTNISIVNPNISVLKKEYQQKGIDTYYKDLDDL